jgi:hypothetical protein
MRRKFYHYQLICNSPVHKLCSSFLPWSSDPTLSFVSYAWTAVPGTYKMPDTVYGNIAVYHMHILEWFRRFRERCENQQMTFRQ